MFRTYSRDQINGTALDKKSVMLYAIPKSWTLDGFESKPNQVLSQVDQSFIGTEKNYPKTAPRKLSINAPAVKTEIGQPGEQDTFEFSVTEFGTYTVETEGPTDVMMSLYRSVSQTQPRGEDDDSGTDRNAKLSMPLEPGTYRVQVRHFNSSSGTGKYNIKVTKAAALGKMAILQHIQKHSVTLNFLPSATGPARCLFCHRNACSLPARVAPKAEANLGN